MFCKVSLRNLVYFANSSFCSNFYSVCQAQSEYLVSMHWFSWMDSQWDKCYACGSSHRTWNISALTFHPSFAFMCMWTPNCAMLLFLHRNNSSIIKWWYWRRTSVSDRVLISLLWSRLISQSCPLLSILPILWPYFWQ